MTKPYSNIPIRENNDPMVNLADYPFILSPEYFSMGFSDTSKMYQRREFADRLLEIQEKHLNGLIFKIWDAWRPRKVQQAIYDDYFQSLQKDHPDWDKDRLHTQTLSFVAQPDNPQYPPPHSTGGAVDLTLCEKDGTEINMGTGFDHFGPESARDYFENPAQDHHIRDHRRHLFAAMENLDFGPHPGEWWHYDFGNQRWAHFTQKDFAFYAEVTHI